MTAAIPFANDKSILGQSDDAPRTFRYVPFAFARLETQSNNNSFQSK
jgi:hypothetical protein